MNDAPDTPTPPEGLPEQLVSDLNALTTEELRKTIIHAQELLNVQDEAPSPIDPQPGDDIIRVTEHDTYTEVVKRVYCNEGCDNCPHGTYLYHVTQERHPDGTETAYWRFIRDVELDDE
ncbi:hypothetical protein [Haloterrigena salifodinae]|uniref:hypothetical protein n=1 Tax=Haloterrigena salifodinae TaxID=2675099 RepID=UPI000F866B0C|nr:hypothetical protein [Haloterrigena salifodinae]